MVPPGEHFDGLFCTELNDCRSGTSHTTEHSAIQEAASFKYCLMEGEEIKVE